MFHHALPNKTVIIGAGGHAKVIADILRHDPHVELIGCIGHDSSATVLGLTVLGGDELLPELHEQGVRHAFVAIGNNARRHALAKHAEALGFELVNAISPRAYLATGVTLGTGVAVMPGCVIQPDTRIGSYSIINTGATVDHDGNIGNACHIAPGCHLSGNVTVGDESFLGTGTSVIDGMRIGEGCMIGAGAAVISPIPSFSLAVGVPAVVKRTLA
ncbi:MULTISPECIES: acetyltransferase [unclassified Paenibacillus]|uniref:acetyltransferase n=1 Tax=unclassified Paenibacillus TaxID=185978 RepID=UPI001051A8F7|nr:MULTISPECIES: acetyltransferase [unclassified Paenibacillus]NIK68751.1 UDP-perosamine 4-acetyltransferase [Paenibacillus sp. BK720]TCM98966.1 UDP-perosamine 4-acetyltransferase [Paenibacillus sp. BK033]